MTRTVRNSTLVALGLCLPFEVVRPIVTLSGLRITNLEALAFLAVAAWLAHRLRGTGSGVEEREGESRWKETMKRPLVWAPAALLALTLVSAILAPSHRLEALKVAGRVATGVVVFWVVIDSVRSRSLFGRLVWALVLGAGLSALLGLVEAAGWERAAPVLAWFKESATRVGGTLRVSASFQYATMAAMFFEMTAILAVGMAATASAAWRRWGALAIATAATANVVLASSRAGMVALAAGLCIVLTVAWRRPRMRSAIRPAVWTIGALVALVAVVGWRAETFRTRLVTENDLGWYSARYSVPSTLELPAGETTVVTVGLENSGEARWGTTGSHPFALGYYWQTEDGETVAGRHVEVPLPRPVAPGDSVRVDVSLRPELPAGEYRLVWGMLQHRILWFRHRDVPEARTEVRVVDDPRAPRMPVPVTRDVPGGSAPEMPPTVRRRDLWEVAGGMWIERPLLGIGPGNFRHLYGKRMGLSEWDRRIHSNNLYVEWLVGWGLAGALAFAGVVLLIARRWVHGLGATESGDAVRALALGASLGAFFLHGVLDYFLAFTPHYLLFWMVAGLIVSVPNVTREDR